MAANNLNASQPSLVMVDNGRLRVSAQASSDIHRIGDWARSENLAYHVSPTDTDLWTVDVNVSAVTDSERLRSLFMRLSDLVAETAGKASERHAQPGTKLRAAR